MENHKKSKPGLARSFLQRATSRSSVHQDLAERPLNPADTSGSPLTKAQSSPVTMDQSAPSSIEQSVRLFRLYEALRKGDPSSISTAILESTSHDQDGIEGTSILHLAIQCAETPVVDRILNEAKGNLDVNARDRDGNTPLHVASNLSRAPVVRLLLDQSGVNDAVINHHGKTPLDLAKTPEVYQQLQLARSMYIDARVKEVQELVAHNQYDKLEKLLVDSHFQNTIDINGPELPTDIETPRAGGSLLHEAARKKDAKLIQILLLNGADPFRRDRRGKLPQDVTKDDRTRSILKKSPAAAAAQRGIQEKTILGSSAPQGILSAVPGESAVNSKESREMKGYLKKWTNYTSGYKLRWFVLEDGVLSYYKHQDDAGSACRGAINMKIAKLHMDTQDKVQFEILGKSSVKYHLKANHQVEAKRWVWALNNAIQWSKDEAKEEQKRSQKSAELIRQAKVGQGDKILGKEQDSATISGTKPAPRLIPATAVGLSRTPTDDEDGTASVAATSVADDDISKTVRSNCTTAIAADVDDEEEYGDDASSVEAKPVTRDAFMIAAHSARLQLDLLAQITEALQRERSDNGELNLSDPIVTKALTSYEAAVGNLRGLIGDLGRISQDREAYWQYRLEQEVNVRRIWEESMAKVAREQEQLESRIGESEEKRKRTKRALKDALEGQMPTPGSQSPRVQVQEPSKPPSSHGERESSTFGRSRASSGLRKKSTITEVANISDSESDDDIEFFDAVDEGKVEVIDEMPSSQSQESNVPVPASSTKELQIEKRTEITTSFQGYREPLRDRLNIDADNRPRISLWGVLKTMIGKDMTKMTLPVSFNEPTSLLQRAAEDMEYADLLNSASERTDSTERMVYVAAFAASEFASTVGRVAKPFNPLLGETYEYARPDKGYRFFTEQVSHHPPIGAVWAEAPKWDYYGESNIKSKFFGKSFDINHLGTWFVKMRPSSGVGNGSDKAEELYTWKKVTSSVIGIITGAPTVDNYGPMEIKNHTTGEKCLLEFKPRGWKASSAYQVQGKVLDKTGTPRWSIGGRWNDKIYARLTPGFEDILEGPSKGKDGNQAFLVWEAHPRPPGIPFNLTPFVLTLNAPTDSLVPCLPPTDTRLRPDQRAMEVGEYDLAGKEKNRVEEKQRAKRRERETQGEGYDPKWYQKSVCEVTGEPFWDVKRESFGGVSYWDSRLKHDWSACEDIF